MPSTIGRRVPGVEFSDLDHALRMIRDLPGAIVACPASYFLLLANCLGFAQKVS